MDKTNKEKGGKDKKENAKNYVFSTRIEQTPNPDSRVELAATKDALGMQEVNLNWQLSELDKRTIKEANLLIGKELGRTGLRTAKVEGLVTYRKSTLAALSFRRRSSYGYYANE